MSNEAMAWALRADLTGKLSAEHRLVLVALADYARPDDGSAWPSAHTLADRLGTSVRSVRRALDRLERVGLIVRGDQSLVGHLRADRRPVVYQLRLGRRARPAAAEPGTLPAEAPRGDTGVTSSRGDTGVTRTDLRGDTGGTHGVTLVSPKPTTELTTPNSPNHLGDPYARERASRGTPVPERRADRRRPDGTCHRCDLAHPVGTDCPIPSAEEAAQAAARAKAAIRSLRSRPGPEEGEP